MEGILGRPLADNEAIAVNVYQPAPIGVARQEASRCLMDRIEKTTKRVRGVPENEIDAAIDEAVEYVRHHPK